MLFNFKNRLFSRSLTDYKKGFGGQFGVQSDRQDKAAHGWNQKAREERDGAAKTAAETQKNGAQSQQNSDGPTHGAAKSLRRKFEQMASQGEQQVTTMGQYCENQSNN